MHDLRCQYEGRPHRILYAFDPRRIGILLIISKLEHRADMYISTLRSYVEAMGGDLQIRAVFPDGEVRIKQFQDVAK